VVNNQEGSGTESVPEPVIQFVGQIQKLSIMKKTCNSMPFLFAHPLLSAFIILLATEASTFLLFWEDPIHSFEQRQILVSIGIYILKYLVYVSVIFIGVFLWKRKQ